MIIDDEEPARRLVQKYVAEFENIEVIGTASNGLDAVRGINELQPDIVIIDIRMPKLDGFEVARTMITMLHNGISLSVPFVQFTA